MYEDLIKDEGNFWVTYTERGGIELERYEKKGDWSDKMMKILFLRQEEEFWINKILNDGVVTYDEYDVYRSRSESKVASLAKAYFTKYYSAIVEYHEFRNPKTGRFLPYDIFIPDYKIYIEINGDHHYRLEKKYHKKQEDFEYQLYKDKIKKEHAEKNGFFLEIKVGATEDIENNNVITRALKIISEIDSQKEKINDYSI